MRLSSIPVGTEAPRVVHAVIEIPQGSWNKYEYNPALDAFVLDRVLFSPLCYPTEYGWIAGTLSEDGNPLGALVFVSHPTFPGCFMRVRPVGVFYVHEEEAEGLKIIAVADTDPAYGDATALGDLPAQALREIKHFLSMYKQLERKATAVLR